MALRKDSKVKDQCRPTLKLTRLKGELQKEVSSSISYIKLRIYGCQLNPAKVRKAHTNHTSQKLS